MFLVFEKFFIFPSIVAIANSNAIIPFALRNLGGVILCCFEWHGNHAQLPHNRLRGVSVKPEDNRGVVKYICYWADNNFVQIILSRNLTNMPYIL